MEELEDLVNEIRIYGQISSELEALQRVAKGHEISYLELWRGVPNVDYELTTDRSGKLAKRYDKDGNYIWVTHDALIALERDRNVILSVLRSITPTNKVEAWFIEPIKENLEIEIKRCKEFNESAFRKLNRRQI